MPISDATCALHDTGRGAGTSSERIGRLARNHVAITRACALFIGVEPNDAKKARRITSPEAPPVRLTLSVAEAAQALGISRTLAYELAHTGDLRTVKLGRRVVVPQSALTELLERPSAKR